MLDSCLKGEYFVPGTHSVSSTYFLCTLSNNDILKFYDFFYKNKSIVSCSDFLVEHRDIFPNEYLNSCVIFVKSIFIYGGQRISSISSIIILYYRRFSVMFIIVHNGQNFLRNGRSTIYDKCNLRHRKSIN